MSSPKVLFGFHAVGVRLKTAPQSIVEIYFEPTRRDARMRQFIERVKESGVRLIEADGLRLSKLCGSHGHQGVAARVEAVAQVTSLDELLEQVEARGESPLLLVLDGITDPHNLGACLRVADGAGAHAVIAPKDHAAGINATVAKVASGARDHAVFHGDQPGAHAQRTEGAQHLDHRHQRRCAENPVPGGSERPGRPGAGRRRRRHAPAHPQNLRRTGLAFRCVARSKA
jgi:tRNA G18 (ribose-2'-O)-methylase SpoU